MNIKIQLNLKNIIQFFIRRRKKSHENMIILRVVCLFVLKRIINETDQLAPIGKPRNYF